MWTSILDLDPMRVLLTRLLGPVWHDAYFSSFAPLSVRNLPRQPLPAANWVRVRNRLAGICGSDLHLIHADGDLRIAPAALPGHRHSYLGHEVVGEVLEIGEGVQTLAIGDRVVLQYGPNCFSAGVQPLCRSCAVGNYNLCQHGRLPGPLPIGGGWSEEMLLHEQQLYRLAPSINDEQAVLIEPTAVALHAVLRRLPEPGERVLIIGAGTIGLLTLHILRILAPQAEISVLARHPFQVERATRMGARHIIYPQDSYASVQQATGAQWFKGMLGNQMLLGGFDVIYDTVGHRKTLHHALRWTRPRGTVVLVGLHLHMMKIDLTPIWYQEIKLIGALSHGKECWPSGSNAQRSTFSIVEEMMEHGQFHPEQLITHHFALDKYQQALTIAANKGRSRAIKVVFDYSLQPPSVVPNVRASARRRPSLSRSTLEPLPLPDSLDAYDGPLPVELPATPPPVSTSFTNDLSAANHDSHLDHWDTGSPEDDIEEEDTVPAMPAVEIRPAPIETFTEKIPAVSEADVALDGPRQPTFAFPQDELTPSSFAFPEEDLAHSATIMPEDEPMQQEIVLPQDQPTQKNIVLPQDELTQPATALPEDEPTQQDIVLPQDEPAQPTFATPADEPMQPAITIAEEATNGTEPGHNGTGALPEIVSVETQDKTPKPPKSTSTSSNSKRKARNTVTKSSSETLSHSEKPATARGQQRTPTRKKK
ncbi:MAG TPA: alcohol dehydrogenase catalytic domain-containing protein [Ktedonobacteraceae bacterium]|nr:alcohol dehydrogenase catalytic domain-containing protein [Ktedonobacteraceae bacterium]